MLRNNFWYTYHRAKQKESMLNYEFPAISTVNNEKSKGVEEKKGFLQALFMLFFGDIVLCKGCQ